MREAANAPLEGAWPPNTPPVPPHAKSYDLDPQDMLDAVCAYLASKTGECFVGQAMIQTQQLDDGTQRVRVTFWSTDVPPEPAP